MLVRFKQPAVASHSREQSSWLRLRAVFAGLALLCQLVVATLPMRASAEITSWTICTHDTGSKTPHGAHHGPLKPEHSCPVCLAIHLAGTTLPPTASALVAPSVKIRLTAMRPTQAVITRNEFRPQQARGPPRSRHDVTT